MYKLHWLAGLLLGCALLLAPATAQAGGWAVVTLVDLPHTVAVGEPVELEFVVRQHGHPEGLLSGLSPVVTASFDGQMVQAEAQAGDGPGRYRATLVLPAAGNWQWSINAFGMPVAMPALTAHEPLSPALLLLVERFLAFFGFDATTVATISTDTPAQRGRDLFVAKGCATCHRHDSIEATMVSEVGPDLSDYETNSEFVRVWLQNAATFTSDRMWPMPTLELNDAEIDALIAFLDANESPDDSRSASRPVYGQ